jgi:hypothetical protein
MSSLALAFPQPLAERYQPQTVSEFVGLEKPKRMMGNFCANPYPSAWLFVGPSGTATRLLAGNQSGSGGVQPCWATDVWNRPHHPAVTGIAR